MKKIKDGTYRAKRMDGSGYVYGYYRYKEDYAGHHFIKEIGQNDWITPIHKNTLVYRKDGKWVKV